MGTRGYCARSRSCGTIGQDYIETFNIGSINTELDYDEGTGTNQAVAGLIFRVREQQTVASMAAYVLQNGGAATGSFQMAILQSVSNSIASVIAVTPVVASITNGIYVLPLTAPVVLASSGLYYLAVYNQVETSVLGAASSGLAAANNAPPINFRVQNIAGFTVGDAASTSDVSLQITPWLAAY